LQITGATAAAPDDGFNCLFGRVPFTEDPAYRRHKTNPESAPVMHFPILPDRNLSKNFAGLARRETSTA
jgi:hypothetical protein